MSLVPEFADNFSLYTSAASVTFPSVSLWDNAGFNAGSNFGRFGGNGMTVSGTPVTKTLPTSISTRGFGFAIMPNSNTATSILLLYDSAGTVQGTLQRNADGSLSVYRGNGVTLLGSTAGIVLPINAIHHVEVHCKVDPTTGTWDVWVDGVSVISLSGLNTRASAVVGSGIARYGHGGASSLYWFMDCHAYDATGRTGATGGTFEHYGDKRIQGLFASGAGTGDVNPANWIQTGGTGGSPWTAVNERPQNGDTSFLADATVGDIKTFALDDLAAGTTGVSAIYPTICFDKDDATTRALDIGVRTSSTNAFGADIQSPSAYAYSQQARTTDGSGAALTPTGVNATEFAMKIAA